MTPDQWERVKELLAEVLERPPAEREAFLRIACAGDDALQAELGSLLAEEHALGDFLDTSAIPRLDSFPTGDVDRTARDSGNGPVLPASIGNYRIIDLIGKGGMAVVYKAEQQEPRRIVALKIIKPGLAGRDYELRFEREKNALARLQHPGIARIYDAGTADTDCGPQAYFAMELIAKAQALTAYAENKRLKVRQRLELMVQVCDAVQHAHQHFIIHRDLKPNNILVDESGQPKVLDFGVARITDSEIEVTRQTDLGQVIGTLDYMSPEQAVGDPNELDTRSDVYALGAILYELLAGKRPYDLHRQGYLEALCAIREVEPARLGLIKPQYRGDVETIVAKCLEKDKVRRYASAAELGTDIRHYLNDEPITARPASVTYQLQKFTRRNKAIVGGAAGILVVLVVGIVATAWLARVADQERDRTREARGEAKARELSTYALDSIDEDPERSALLGMQAVNATLRFNRPVVLVAEDALQRAIESLAQVQLTLGGYSAVFAVAFSPDGKRLATAGLDGVKVWDAAGGQRLQTLRGQSDVYCVAFSPDGTRLATASSGGTAWVWDAAGGQPLQTLRGHSGGLSSVAFSPDGTRLATASIDKTAKVWDAASGKELLTVRGHTGVVWSVAFGPDGARLATAGLDGTARVWNVASGKELLTLRHLDSVRSVAFSPDGKRLATASADKTAKLWDAASGRELLTLRGHTSGVNGVAFSPDGKSLLTASADKTAREWDAVSGQKLLTLRGHTSGVNGVAFSLDGKRIATASDDKTAKVWDAAELLTLRGHSAGISSVAFSQDGNLLATSSYDKTAKVWDAASGKELLTLRDHTGSVSSVSFSPGSNRLATASNDGTAKVWDAISGRKLLTLLGHTSAVNALAFSPDGKRIATASNDGTAKVWDATSAKELLTLRGHTTAVLRVAFSPDGTRLATAGWDLTAKVWDATVWDAANGRGVLNLARSSSSSVWCVAFSPDGKRLATASNDGTAKVWDAVNGRKLLTLLGHTSAVNGVTFSPDGKRIATASDDKTAKVWDAVTGQELLTLRGHSDRLISVAFSPDGRRLATASLDGTALVNDALDIHDLLALAKKRVTRGLTPAECQRYLQTQTCPILP